MVRYPEVDLARLLAMVMMAVYHTAFDLSSFYDWSIDLSDSHWWTLQKATLMLFLFVSGVSAAITWKHSNRSRKKFFKRGLILLAWAMFITLATFVVAPEEYIRFGVLHSIAVSMFLLPFFLSLGLWNTVLGITIILLGQIISEWTVSTSLLLPLGLMPPIFRTLDYVPLIPSFGVILLGAALGHVLYVRGWRAKKIEFPRWLQTLSIPGKYSLAFYLIHQPVILAILLLLLGVPNF